LHSFARKYRYDVALLYLNEVDYNLEAAIEAYKDDEKEHPIEAANVKGKGKTRNNVGRRRFTGQKP
jgi:demethoxyubiquinone hydroxylase (CLK1/Coq7/Cat5 family)